MRQFVLATALVAAWCPGGRLLAARRSEIIPETTAARHGLTRAWFTQVRMDRSRARIQDIVLQDGFLYVQSDRAMVHVINAETGETIWAKRVGRPNHPSMTPAAAGDLVAVINGSRLYVCNRYNGDLLYEIQIDGAPGAGACLSKRRAYVPMVGGLVMAYRLKPLTDPQKELGMISETPTAQGGPTPGESPTGKEAGAEDGPDVEQIQLSREYIPPLACHSFGRALVQPLVTSETENEEFVAWPTDRGLLYVGRIDVRSEDRFAARYRLETNEAIVSRPTYLPGDPSDPNDSGVIFATSRDGFVHAIRERDGESLWRFSTGEPILEPAVPIGPAVYVATQPGGMYCLDAQTGNQLWWTPEIRQFVAASTQRVYGADRLGRILTLGAETGARLDVIAAEHLPIKLVNSQTDRLYLGTPTGLIQCLHELELAKPVRHREVRKKKAEQQPTIQQKGIEEVEAPEKPGAEDRPAPAGGQDPFSPRGGPT